MMIREPAVAGTFYPSQPDQCLAQLQACLQSSERGGVEPGGDPEQRSVIGGIAPHAGWQFSGTLAGHLFREVAQSGRPGVVVLFGAVHVPHGARASLFPSGAWETPLGLARVEGRLAERLLGQTGLLDADPHAHEHEHSIEVLVPFVQHLLPNALIVPIMVPPNDQAVPLGQAVARTCKAYGVDAVFIGSTDLTHYGPSYGFVPKGVGPAGLTWAQEVNDRRIIDLILDMRADEVVREAAANHNACGAGAIAATIAACESYGATQGTLLEHTTSTEVLGQTMAEPPRDAVGYAAVAFTD